MELEILSLDLSFLSAQAMMETRGKLRGIVHIDATDYKVYYQVARMST